MKHTTIITVEEQKKLGKYETPKNIAEFIVEWAIRSSNDLILEPCVGSGILFFKAIQQLERFQLSNMEACRRVYGVDIDSIAVKKITQKLDLEKIEKSNVICMDFLRTTPNKELPLVTAIICNPPYTRHQYLDEDYKEEIAKKIEENISSKLSRQSGLYTHFLIHASQFLKEKGRMVFVLPSSFLDVNYGVALKKFLINNFKIIALLLFPKERLLFPKVLTTTCILFLEKKNHKKNIVKFLKIKSVVNSENLLEVINSPNLLNEELITITKINQSSLNPMKKWSHYFGHGIQRENGLIRLGVIAKVKRGIATGANSFFTLSDEEVQEFEIEQRFLKSVLTKARDAPFFDFTKRDFHELLKNGKKVWLVSSDLEKEKLQGTKLLEYIEKGEIKKFHHRYLTRKRRIWYSSEKRTPSPIIFTYMSRKRPRFILNEARTLVLNNFHLVYPEDKKMESKVKIKALLAYLNSEQVLSRLENVGRIYAGGLLKVEPKELEKLPVIHFEFDRKYTQTLANLFDKLCTSVRTGSDEQEIQNEIDQVVDSLEKLQIEKKEGYD